VKALAKLPDCKRRLGALSADPEASSDGSPAPDPITVNYNARFGRPQYNSLAKLARFLARFLETEV
jgi:hypothetical protein